MNMLKYLAIAALAFQAFHFAEHGIQLGYWFAHPLSAPWMTPWAMAAVQALALAGDHALGNELLHLGGNIIFVSGLVAFGCYWRGRHGASNSPHLRTAVSIQGIHVAEHVALTLTMVVWGKAIGVTTLFGLATGPLLFTSRIWFHFLINVVATWYAGKAVADSFSRPGARPATAVVAGS